MERKEKDIRSIPPRLVGNSKLSETDTPEVETWRFETLHTQTGTHLDTATSVEKARGFLTTRTLPASTLLTDYSNWPGLAQVYQYRIERKHLRTGEITHQTQYGITSLAPQDASAEDLLTLRRGHWTIENKVHWIRDVVFGEDASQVRTGGIPQVMAALRNTVLSVLRFKGIQRSPKHSDFSQRGLNSQLNSSIENS